MAGRCKGWGGPRPGSGRPPEPPETVRRNRISITVTDLELAKLQAYAKRRRLPVATVVYELLKPRIERL